MLIPSQMVQSILKSWYIITANINLPSRVHAPSYFVKSPDSDLSRNRCFNSFESNAFPIEQKYFPLRVT